MTDNQAAELLDQLNNLYKRLDGIYTSLSEIELRCWKMIDFDAETETKKILDLLNARIIRDNKQWKPND